MNSNHWTRLIAVPAPAPCVAAPSFAASDLAKCVARLAPLEFDDQGSTECWSVTIRPSKCEWFVEDFDAKGMKGVIAVR